MTTPSRCAALGRVESELVSLLWKALTRDGSVSLSMWLAALHGVVVWCSLKPVVV